MCDVCVLTNLAVIAKIKDPRCESAWLSSDHFVNLPKMLQNELQLTSELTGNLRNYKPLKNLKTLLTSNQYCQQCYGHNTLINNQNENIAVSQTDFSDLLSCFG